MKNDDGPIGILKLNEQNYLVLGPYYASYDVVNARDGLAYIVILLVFNSICLWAGLSYFRSKFKTASQAINQVSESIYLDKKQDVLVNVSENTPELANKICQLQKEHRLNLRNQRDLMHAVAHEFRGPMARISFAIDLLTSDQNRSNSAQLKLDIEESLEELDSLVKEVLDYSRLKDGHQELIFNSFNIHDSVESLIKKLTPLYDNKQFEIRSTEKNIECSLDQKLIERCLLNLLRNAARFSFSKVRIDISQIDSKLIINVEDDGSGIPPGKRQRIFEPFTRLDHSRSRDSGGAGLGLAIVWSITKRHQGDIQVQDSEDLGGAHFRLSLPLEVES